MDESLLLVEKHDAVRDALQAWLKAVFNGWRIDKAKSVAEAVEVGRRDLPRVILVGSGANGIEVAREIAEAVPDAEVVVLTTQDHKAYYDDLIAAGASACIPEWKISTELKPAIVDLVGEWE